MLEKAFNLSESSLAAYLQGCSYTDFVGTINQTNVPPGSYHTISKWATYGSVHPDSFVVEVACTTGFSLRELARKTGCRGVGFDISRPSVAKAEANLREAGLENRVSYITADGLSFEPSEKASHVVVGAALGFFPNARNMLERCLTFFDQRGTILASPFYLKKTIPSDLIAEARQVLNMTPTVAGYKEVMSHYQGLQIHLEERHDLVEETVDELKHYCLSTAARAMHELGSHSSALHDVIFSRLFQIRDLCNRLRPYQQYSILVFEFNSKEFPNRYVELF
jgi:ubiquinone/menaquinone biosynthesis C-methylase UbiE